jgi:hypothetical protein
MKCYWDASALIDALHDSRVEQKALEPDQWTRAHALSETFATLTGAGSVFGIFLTMPQL